MTYGIFWLLFSVAAGIFASNRGRSGIGWFFISLLISPLLGLIFVAIMKDLSQPLASAGQPSSSTHVKCPSCAEFVLPEAKVCKHCGTDLVPVINHQQRQEQLASEDEAKDTINLIIGIVFIIGLVAIASVLSRCGS